MRRPSIYSRPAKPLFVPVPKRDWRERTISDKGLPAPVAVHAGTECHVTPPAVAARMVAYAGDLQGLDVLEPSAGTGNIVRAMLEAGADPTRLALVEMHADLVRLLWDVCRPVHQSDFLEMAREWRGYRSFDRIVMNPPFKPVRAHVAAAVSLLRPGGCVVALVPVTFEHADAIELERLPADTFAAAKVHTKIVRIECQ